MSDDRSGSAPSAEIPREEWKTWCETATERQSGRVIKLHFVDLAIGEVRLAEGQRFIAIEHDELGTAVALTIKYGDGVVPVRYVIAEPRQVLQEFNDAGEVVQVTIVDSTERRTYISLA